MPRIMPEPRYFSMPSSVVGAVALRKAALNCRPWVRSFTQLPEALTNSPAETRAACPTTVARSLWPRTLTRSTQKPVSALWKVTRSTRPASASVAGAAASFVPSMAPIGRPKGHPDARPAGHMGPVRRRTQARRRGAGHGWSGSSGSFGHHIGVRRFVPGAMARKERPAGVEARPPLGRVAAMSPGTPPELSHLVREETGCRTPPRPRSARIASGAGQYRPLLLPDGHRITIGMHGTGRPPGSGDDGCRFPCRPGWQAGTTPIGNPPPTARPTDPTG